MEQAEYYRNPKLLGPKVFSAFESARLDISEAGNCYATDNFTACVFHLMRVTECGMRVLAKDLKINRVGKHPLLYAEWGRVCIALETKIKALQNKPGRGSRKSIGLKRYADAASQVHFINDIWRKDVSHTREPYNQPEALNAMTRVREFMERALAVQAGKLSSKPYIPTLEENIARQGFLDHPTFLAISSRLPSRLKDTL